MPKPKVALPAFEPALSAGAQTALAALKPTLDDNAATGAIAKLVKAMTPVDRASLYETFAKVTRDFVKLSRGSDWQKIDHRIRRAYTRRLQMVATALRDKHAKELTNLILDLRVSWLRSELFEVLMGLFGAKPIAQRELANKILAEKSPDRIDLYKAIEALVEIDDHKRIRAILRGPAKTYRQRELLEIVGDVLEQKQSIETFAADLFPHTVTVQGALFAIEGDAATFVKFLKWAPRSTLKLSALVSEMIEHAHGLRNRHGQTWITKVTPALETFVAAMQKRKVKRANELAEVYVEVRILFP